MSVAIFTAVKNEGPYLLDWLAHHHVIGVERIVIYSDAPDDGTDKILGLLQDAGIITHIPLSDPHPSAMVEAQKHFWQSSARERSEWVIALDVREYLTLKSETGLLPDLLARTHKNTDALVLPRQIYGHNDYIEISEHPISTTHKKCGRTPAIFPFEATYGKNIIRNKQVFQGIGFYRGKQKPPGKGRDLNIFTAEGNRLPDYYAQHEKRLSIMGAYEGESDLVVGFYPLRSVGDYILNGYYFGPQHKRSDPDLKYWIENNFNNVDIPKNATLDARRDRERKNILNQVEGLRGAIDKSLIWHREKLNEALLVPKSFELYNTCLLAQTSEQPRRAMAQNLYLLRQKQEDLEYEEEVKQKEDAERKRDNKHKRKRKQRRQEKKNNP